ncbi:hypothetical protein HNI00_08335 [Thermoleptolyngbya oregonensis NK1-22]|uniref:Uncharacterized protein n=1 Tax=Thermoleptolyngbya oregonensis NK1-22 TaxID=2547457 RepID=A0AA96Y2J0_9CYAN|nr:hypothetical protein [Thermoleptolyngbya oregonensis]WOB41721.1 hypothetical protein HNI00_08335 [Thermoleptolyngbya oregonensis NK1-22]
MKSINLFTPIAHGFEILFRGKTQSVSSQRTMQPSDDLATQLTLSLKQLEQFKAAATTQFTPTADSAQRQRNTWQGFVRWLTQAPELRVWQTRYASGQVDWHAYDPERDRHFSTDSEDEMRRWIEARYAG